jgi:hydrogenase maturation protease
VKKILLHAYGNPGRQDDGLGNECIARMEGWIRKGDHKNIATDSSYQLNIEDASVIADYDIVIFIDASKGEINSYSFEPVAAQKSQSFSTHSVSPSALLALCTELFQRTPLVYLLQIKGYEWEFGEGLSREAGENLRNAIQFLQSTVLDFQKQESEK